MCCSGNSCGNHHCRCICLRCRMCGTCCGDETGFGSGIAGVLLTGGPKKMLSRVSKTRPNELSPSVTEASKPKDNPFVSPPAPGAPVQPPVYGGRMLRAAHSGCAQQ